MIFTTGLILGIELSESAPGGEPRLLLGFALALAACLSLPAVFAVIALVQVVAEKVKKIREGRCDRTRKHRRPP